MPALLIEMASHGFSGKAFCAKAGICYATFLKWKRNIPEFGDAVAKADMVRQLFYEKTALENMENRDFNCAVFDRLTRSVAKWNDNNEVHHTHNHTHQIKPPEEMTAAERQERIKQLLAENRVN